MMPFSPAQPHYTADNFDVSLATLTDKEVSSHYLIPEQPPRHHWWRGGCSGIK
jgi:N-acetyl-anhydromuramyl-L-alanine amidase AmpD